MSARVPRLYLPLLFFVLGSACIFLGRNAPVKDFGNYYYGSKLLLDEKFDERIYTDIAWFNAQIAAYGEHDFFENYIPVPPFSAIFYLPFCLLDSLKAKLLFNVLSLLLFCWSLHRLQRFLPVNSLFLYTLPFIFLYPLYNNIVQGQSYLLLCALFLEIYMASEKKQVYLTALLVALVIALKLFPGLIVLYFIFRKDLKTLVYTLGVTLVFILLTVLVLPGNTSVYYFTHVLPRLFNNDVIGAFHPVNQSVYSAALNLFCKDGLANPDPLLNSPLLVILCESLVMAFLLAVTSGLRKAPSFLFFGFVLFSTLLLSRYHASYSTFLLLPLCLYLPGHLKASRLWLVFSVIVVLITLPGWDSNVFLLQFRRLWGLLLLLVLLILFLRPAIRLRVFAAFFIPLCVLRYLGFPIQHADYFAVQNSAGILYSLELKGDSIQLNSTLGEKTQAEQFCLPGKARTDSKLVLEKNQLYYKGKLVSHSGDNKASPFIYKDSLIVFMSDLNQALRFYKLRSLPLPRE